MGKLDGKVAIITGGSAGIGKGIARAFGGEGCSVIIAARNAQRLEQAARDLSGLPGKVVGHVADVTDEASVQRLFDETLSRLGRLDILVNCAGVSEGGPLDHVALEKFRRVLDINLVGPFLCTRAALRIMKAAGGGRIINIGSLAASRARELSAPYTVSKHGLWGLTQCTALDGRDFGISCGQIDPGNVAVERRMALGARPASGRDSGPEPMIPTESIAGAALYMATLPPEANALQMTVLPVKQPYIGRG